MESAQAEFEKFLGELDAKIRTNRQRLVPPAIQDLSSAKIELYLKERNRLEQMRKRAGLIYGLLFGTPGFAFYSVDLRNQNKPHYHQLVYGREYWLCMLVLMVVGFAIDYRQRRARKKLEHEFLAMSERSD